MDLFLSHFGHVCILDISINAILTTPCMRFLRKTVSYENIQESYLEIPEQKILGKQVNNFYCEWKTKISIIALNKFLIQILGSKWKYWVF